MEGTEDRLEVGTELRGLPQGPSPLLSEVVRVWEVGRGPPGLVRPQPQGKRLGVGVTKGCAGGAGGGMLLLTAGAGLAVAEGRLDSERAAAGALRPVRATFIVRISRSQPWALYNWPSHWAALVFRAPPRTFPPQRSFFLF